MKLWQALDPQSQAVLCTPEGAQDFLRSFPAEQRDVLAQAAASALDSEVADDSNPEQAMQAFADLVAADLTAHGMAATGLRPSGKPVLPS